VPEIYHISLIGTRGITGIECSSPYAKEDSETRDEAEELCYAPSMIAVILAVVTSILPGGALGCDCIFHLNAIRFEVTATHILQALAVCVAPTFHGARLTLECIYSPHLHRNRSPATPPQRGRRRELRGTSCATFFVADVCREYRATLCQHKLSLQSLSQNVQPLSLA